MGPPLPTPSSGSRAKVSPSCQGEWEGLAVLGKGCGAGREEQGPASAGLSYPAAGRGPPPGGSPDCLCAAGLPAPAPAEPPGAGSAASQWSPARGEESREGKKASLVTKSVLQRLSYKYWFLGWVGKSQGGAQLSCVASMIPCHLKSSPPSPAPPSPSALLAQAFSARAPYSDHCSSSCRVARLPLHAATPTRTRVHTYIHTHTQFSPQRLKYFKNTYSKSCPTLLFRYHPTHSYCP